MLVFGRVPLNIDHLLQLPRHGVGQFLQVGDPGALHPQSLLLQHGDMTEVMLMEWSWSFIQFLRFSIELRSEEEPGQSMMVNGWSVRFA